MKVTLEFEVDSLEAKKELQEHLDAKNIAVAISNFWNNSLRSRRKHTPDSLTDKQLELLETIEEELMEELRLENIDYLI